MVTSKTKSSGTTKSATSFSRGAPAAAMPFSRVWLRSRKRMPWPSWISSMRSKMPPRT